MNTRNHDEGATDESIRRSGDVGIAESDVVDETGGMRGADLRADGQCQGLLLPGNPEEHVGNAGVPGGRGCGCWVVWM